jgi:zinc protease
LIVRSSGGNALPRNAQWMKPAYLIFALSLALAPAAYAKTTTAATAPAPAPAAAPVAAKTPWLYEGSDIPVDTTWTFGTLPNGLRYAVKRNDVPAGQVSIRVRIDAGALYEEDKEQGYAHLLEHLSFRGSEYVADGESKRIWQRLGVSFGSDSNAQTTPTQTVYKLDLPASTPATIGESMKMLSGMMRAPNITQVALDAERAIVLAELRESDSAQLRLEDKTRAHFFQGQKLARRGTIGTPQTLRSADIAGLRAFHQRWYRPGNTTVVISGDADPVALADFVRQNFGNWKVEGARTPQPDFGQPTKTGIKAAAVADPALPLSATIAYTRPWTQVNDTIVYNEQLMIDGLAQRIINRRLEYLARDGASFTLAQIGQQDVSRTADMTIVNVKPLADDWEKAVREVRAVIADAQQSPPVQADIERELAIFADEFRTRVDSYRFEAGSKQAEDMVRAVDIRETVAAPQTVVSVFDGMRAKFTPERVFAATKALFEADASYILLSGPNVPAGVETKLATVLTAPVVGNVKARLAATQLGFDALPALGVPGKLVSAEKDPNFDIEKIVFSNGARAILSPNKAEEGQVRVLVRFGRGYQAVTSKSGGLLWSGPMVLPDNGIGTLTRSQIDQMINGRRIELSFNVDNDAFEFSSTTRPADLLDQLKLIAAKLDHPGWQSAAVERAKAFAISEYDGFAMSSLAVMQRDLQYLLSGRDARWKIQPPAAVKTLTPAQFRQFWEPLLASGPVEILIFGDFDRDAALRAIEQTIAAKKPRRAATVPAGANQFTFPPSAATPLKLTHKGPTDQAATIIAWPTGGGLETISEGRELEIVAALFRDRLFEKFRSQQAASYSPDSISNWPDEFANGGFVMAYSQVQPKDRERFFAFAREVAADLATKPVSADELQRAVEPAKQYVERSMSGNLFWMSQMEGASFAPQRLTALQRLYQDYAKVTPARIMELAKRYFRADREWTMVIEPEGMR